MSADQPPGGGYPPPLPPQYPPPPAPRYPPPVPGSRPPGSMSVGAIVGLVFLVIGGTILVGGGLCVAMLFGLG